MRRLLSALCASALATSISVTSVLPLAAAPVVAPRAAASAPLAVVPVQSGNEIWMRRQGAERSLRGDDARRVIRRMERDNDRRIDRRDMRRIERRVERRVDRRIDRHDFRRSGDHAWYRGHRGYRDYRRGYREYNGFWFPAAAFVAGAIISGAIANQPRVSYGSAHVDWCYDRYRSYRASDNTFQPYNGPRQQCYSPYS